MSFKVRESVGLSGRVKVVVDIAAIILAAHVWLGDSSCAAPDRSAVSYLLGATAALAGSRMLNFPRLVLTAARAARRPKR